MLQTLAETLSWLGLAVFAATGAIVAAHKKMDVIGFAMLATVTGIGGGTLRDLLLGLSPVFWVRQPQALLVCFVVGCLVFFSAKIRNAGFLVWFDAIGLAVEVERDGAALGEAAAVVGELHPNLVGAQGVEWRVTAVQPWR